MIMWQGHSCLSIIRHLYTYRKPFSSQRVDFVLRFKRHMSPYRVLTCLKGRDYRCDRRNPSKFHYLPVVLPSLQWRSSLLIWPFKGHKWWNTSHTSGGDGDSAWTDWRWRPGRRPHLPIFPAHFPAPFSAPYAAGPARFVLLMSRDALEPHSGLLLLTCFELLGYWMPSVPILR